jgi:YesN/AraC family two-component response regulator
MPKKIRRNEDIYLAPGILGRYENDEPVAIDENNGYERLNPGNLADKIRIYKREVEEWFLNPAANMLGQESFRNSFIVLMVCMSYIEGVEQYKTGTSSNSGSKAFFVRSFKRLYPNRFQDKHIEKLYSKARCGLFHNGMVKGGVIFNNDYNEPIEFEDDGETIRINPQILLSNIKNDFERYINELTNSANATTRGKFDRMFTVL